MRVKLRTTPEMILWCRSHSTNGPKFAIFTRTIHKPRKRRSLVNHIIVIIDHGGR